MSNFHNPYHFVPFGEDNGPETVTREAFRRGARPHVTHDRFVERVYSGRLIARLTLEDPVVIGSRRYQADEPGGGDRGGIHVVEPFEMGGKPAIPASTLRGLIGSIAEAASNSAMRVLVNRPFSYRAAMSESMPALGMIAMTQEGPALRPLALPGAPTVNPLGTMATLDASYTTMFTDALVKVYVNGYTPVGGGGQDRVVPTGFLARPGLKSHCADNHGEFWYLKLRGGCALNQQDLHVPFPHLDHASGNTLLGQQAAPGEVPITEAQHAAWVAANPGAPDPYTRGILRILEVADRQIPTTKTHDIFIPYPPGSENRPTFPIDPDAWRRFHDMARQRQDEGSEDGTLVPFELKGMRRAGEDGTIELGDGDIVFFKPKADDPGVVGELAISSIWRRWAGRCYDYVPPELQPAHPGRQTISLAEQLFGFVDATKDPSEPSSLALASRVRFSAARLVAAGQPEDLKQPYLPGVELKVLSSPKPPCPSLYFKKRHGPSRFIAKSELSEQNPPPSEQFTLQGRKMYLHRHPGTSEPWRMPNAHVNERRWLRSRVTPLKRGLCFEFHVDFENLGRRELALIGYALRPTEAFRHKLGIGKPLGLGKVRIDPIGILYIDRFRRYRDDSEEILTRPRYHRIRLEGADPTQPTWHEACDRLSGELYGMERRDAKAQALRRNAGSDGGEGYPSARELADEFRAVQTPSHGDIIDALERLGDPRRVTAPVHTPQVGPGDVDPTDDTFRWFVDNEHRHRRRDNRRYLENHPSLRDEDFNAQFLRPLSQTHGANLPRLERKPMIPDN